MKTARQKWLNAMLPAIFVAGAYMWFFGRGINQMAADTEKLVVAAQTEAPSEDLIRKVLAETNTARKTLEQERAKSAQLKAESTALATKAGDVESRRLARQNMASVLANYHLTVMSTSRRNTGGASVKAVEDLRKRAGFPEPEIWSVEAVGTYKDARAALEALSSGADFIIPLNVEMRPANGTLLDPAARSWVLTLWL